MNDSLGAADERAFVASVRRLRDGHGWSQSELARRMTEEGWPNYSQMTVSRTEEGRRKPGLGEAVDLARVLNSSLDAMTAPAEEAQILTGLMQTTVEARASWREIQTRLELSSARRKLLEQWVAQAEEYLSSRAPAAPVREQMEEALKEAKGVLQVGVQDVVDEFIADYSENPELVTDSKELREKLGIGRDGRGLDPEAS